MFCPECGKIMAPGPLSPRCLSDDDAESTGANTELAVKNGPSRLALGLAAMLGIFGGFIAGHRGKRQA
ncbi:MAG: hypothetical protein AB7G25_05155 [Sphingomonadaceae bacterium]